MSKRVLVKDVEIGEEYYVHNGAWYFTVISKDDKDVLIEGGGHQWKIPLTTSAEDLDISKCESTSLIEDYFKDGSTLYGADPNCQHEVHVQWSGVKCIKCKGWFCY